MKIIKYLFFILLIVLIAGAIYVATQDGEYYVEETTVINAPLPVVYKEVNNLENWESWGPWNNEAENIIIDYSETTRGEGASFTWRSEDLGDGSVTTTRAIPDNALDQAVIHNPTMAESRSRMYWEFEEVEEGTRVTLGMEGTQSFREKLAFAFRDNSLTDIMRPRLSNSLEELNRQVNLKMSVYSINVDGLTTHGGGFYMYTSTASKMSQIPVKMQDMVTEIRNYMELNNISAQGDPFVLYSDWDEQNNSAIYSAGIFTPSMVITPQESDILNAMMPVQRVVKTTLKGNYENLQEAWARAYAYIDDNDLQANETSEPFEVYRITAERDINPANWVTEIYIPVIDSSSANQQ